MDKLELAGQNLGQVFNFIHGRAFALCTFFTLVKRSNLMLKTWPKQLLGYLPLAFAIYN
jgi:hypothetical protein